MDYTFVKYLAGYVDGDGSITLMCRKYKDVYYINSDFRLTGEEKSLPILQLCYDTYGGNIYKDPSRNAFQWYCDEKTSVRVLEQVKNHLVLKRPIAEFVIDFYKTRTKKIFSKEEKKKLMKHCRMLRNCAFPEHIHPANPWVAGYIDSDGCFHKNKLTFGTHIRCIPALTLLQKAFGGSIQVTKGYGARYTLYLTKGFPSEVRRHLKLKDPGSACND